MLPEVDCPYHLASNLVAEKSSIVARYKSLNLCRSENPKSLIKSITWPLVKKVSSELIGCSNSWTKLSNISFHLVTPVFKPVSEDFYLLFYYRKRLLISACFFDWYTPYTSKVHTWKKHALISKQLQQIEKFFHYFRSF